MYIYQDFYTFLIGLPVNVSGAASVINIKQIWISKLLWDIIVEAEQREICWLDL